MRESVGLTKDVRNQDNCLGGMGWPVKVDIQPPAFLLIPAREILPGSWPGIATFLVQLHSLQPCANKDLLVSSLFLVSVSPSSADVPAFGGFPKTSSSMSSGSGRNLFLLSFSARYQTTHKRLSSSLLYNRKGRESGNPTNLIEF